MVRPFDAGLVTVRGPADARRAGWPLEIVADLVDGDAVVDLAVDLRHAHLSGDADVAATIAALADWPGVTLRRPTGGVSQSQPLHPGVTAYRHHGRFGLCQTPRDQVARQREVMRFHPSGVDLATGSDQGKMTMIGGDSTTLSAP